VEPKGTAPVQHSKLNANSDLKCVKCNSCMLSNNHDLCVLDFINNVNAHAKSRSVKKNSKRKVWKPTGKVWISQKSQEKQSKNGQARARESEEFKKPKIQSQSQKSQASVKPSQTLVDKIQPKAHFLLL
ncbi:hypothetical protein Tco_0283661, partial [Tanacetum coccineum]